MPIRGLRRRELEQKNQEARVNGALFPDIAHYGTTRYIAYGRVPNDYLPVMPAPDAVIEAIDGDDDRSQVPDEKDRKGALDQITVKLLHWFDVAPQSSCFDNKSPEDEINKRICEDLAEQALMNTLQSSLATIPRPSALSPRMLSTGMDSDHPAACSASNSCCGAPRRIHYWRLANPGPRSPNPRGGGAAQGRVSREGRKDRHGEPSGSSFIGVAV